MGLLYEQEVRRAVQRAGRNIKRFRVLPELTSGYDATSVDMRVLIEGKRYGFEIKQSKNAQMGGSSVRFIDGKFEFSEAGKRAVDPDTQSIIYEILEPRVDDLFKIFQELKKFQPIEYHAGVNTLPFNATTAAIDALRNRQILRPFNITVKRDTNFIANHYAKKDCHYIQIGGMGLYYMKENPLDLPIPKLKGEINVELRLAKSRTGFTKSVGEITSAISLRAQARFVDKNSIKSPYSLDVTGDCLFLFSDNYKSDEFIRKAA